MKKHIHLSQLLIPIFCFTLIAYSYHQQKDQLFLATLKHQDDPYTVVLDAGHGGSDPGKISQNQIKEKDINLSITLECKKILEKQNINVILTRDSDAGLYNESDTNKKKADMQKRREIIDSSNASLAVSIHQNSYPSGDVFGSQVFYYTSSENGKSLANYLQTALLKVNPDNHRTIKDNSDYYILKSGSCPVVICECGFLSNTEECAKLNSKEYQKEIAKAIATGILSYLMHTDNTTTTQLSN